MQISLLMILSTRKTMSSKTVQGFLFSLPNSRYEQPNLSGKEADASQWRPVTSSLLLSPNPPTPALSPLLHMFAPEWTDAPISCHYAGLLELSQEAQHDREKTASSCRDQNRSVQLALDQKGLRKPRGITTCGSYMHFEQYVNCFPPFIWTFWAFCLRCVLISFILIYIDTEL